MVAWLGERTSQPTIDGSDPTGCWLPLHQSGGVASTARDNRPFDVYAETMGSTSRIRNGREQAAGVTPLGVFDDPHYAKLAVENAERYQKAEPFPHIFFDDFLPGELADELAGAYPRPDDIEWIVRDNENNRRRYQHDETKLPVFVRMMFRELNSRQFVLFLETLTGIENLIPDPYFIGGGVHTAGRGDFLKVHADFNWHHKLQAHRRVNALLYMNPNWRPEWEGALEFWDKEMTRAVVSIPPLFNRLAVFNVGEDSNHGQPVPNECPDDEIRKTLNLYYYTTRRDEAEVHDPHFTLYKTEASPFAVQLGEDYRQQADKPTS